MEKRGDHIATVTQGGASLALGYSLSPLQGLDVGLLRSPDSQRSATPGRCREPRSGTDLSCQLLSPQRISRRRKRSSRVACDDSLTVNILDCLTILPLLRQEWNTNDPVTLHHFLLTPHRIYIQRRVWAESNPSTPDKSCCCATVTFLVK